MNLGYVIPEFPAQTHAFFWREIVALRESGVSVRVVSTRRPEGPPCRHAFAEAGAAETHYVYPPRWGAALAALLARPVKSAKALGYLLGLRQSPLGKRLKRLGQLLCAADLVLFCKRQGIDHLHVHSCGEAAHLAALCRILGGPTYSLTLHGELDLYGTDHRHKTRRAAFVAGVTAALRKDLVARVGLPAERTLAAPMGVDTDQFHDAGRRAVEPGKLSLITVARLEFNKGHRYALAAVRAVVDAGCDVRYAVAGAGPYRREIEAEVARLGLGDRVEFTGTLSEADVCARLQRADAFVLPSTVYEAAPVSVMEAMACGLPVVCSIIGGTPDMIADGRDGLLVAQRDAAGLAAALVRLARDPAERRRLGAAARRRAVEQFDRRATARVLREAIERALVEPVHRPDAEAPESKKMGRVIATDGRG